MRWKRTGRSRNLEDRRSRRSGGLGGAIGGLARGRRAPMSLGGIVILLLLSVIFKQDFFALLGTQSGLPAGGTAGGDFQTTPQEEELVDFVSFVLDDAQNLWIELLPRYGGRYREAKLVLFRDVVTSACGRAGAATGPFYCPGDEKVYIDLGFYRELRDRFGAAGDFAQAYVLAHEIGHHVQNVTGTERQVRGLQRANPREANRLSVMMELQADCYAGIWGHSTARRDLLEAGDIEEGLTAAAAIGDDRLQKQATGTVNPDAFTHGSSAQRVEWFRRGLETGDVAACDTFAGL